MNWIYYLPLFGLCALLACSSQDMNQSLEKDIPKFEPTAESLASRPLPNWFEDEKLGIFIHWGPSAVPGWAPNTHSLENVDFSNPEDWKEWFKNCAYSGWYLNSMRVPGNPTIDYHIANFGKDFSYFNFGDMFSEEVLKWDPEAMASLIESTGAGYVVLTTKHHDGYLLWPSARPNPFVDNYFSSRDLVGELAEAVRERNMRFGVYYSTGIDWTFNDHVVKEFMDLLTVVPQTEEYIAYLDAHLRELIDRYEPSVLWADIGSPEGFPVNELFADYYNRIEDGVVNNRFKLGGASQTGEMASPIHADFDTPEYAVFSDIQDKKWESTRGLAYAFFYNRNEIEDNYLSAQELIHMFIDIVSKNGNLLLNIGPRPDGSVPEFQVERLKALGKWMDLHKEGIHGTRPWSKAEGKTLDGTQLRFTQKGDNLFVFHLGSSQALEIVLPDLGHLPIADIKLLGHDLALFFEISGKDLKVQLPKDVNLDPLAWGLQVSLK